jgi:hypothetical protein
VVALAAMVRVWGHPSPAPIRVIFICFLHNSAVTKQVAGGGGIEKNHLLQALKFSLKMVKIYGSYGGLYVFKIREYV